MPPLDSFSSACSAFSDTGSVQLWKVRRAPDVVDPGSCRDGLDVEVGRHTACAQTPTAGKVLITTDVPDQKTAWSKARQDVLAITREAGYEVLPMPPSLSPWAWMRFFAALNACVASGGSVLVEHPIGQRRRLLPLFAWCRSRRARLHGLIHDLDALRSGSPPAREMSVLKLFDGLVSHNAVMSSWLKSEGFSRSVVDLNLFDYMLSGDSVNDHSWHEDFLSDRPLKVVCAGNLSPEKAGYIYDARLGELEGVDISLFGAFFEPERMPTSFMSYKGVFEPNSPRLDGRYHFGLVWDGQSAQCCEGAYGHYMRYNNPHKVSLYAALGLPVVVWSESAVAHLVLERGVGVAVSDLRELATIRDRITGSDYVGMCRHMGHLRREVTQGHFLRAALDALESKNKR